MSSLPKAEQNAFHWAPPALWVCPFHYSLLHLCIPLEHEFFRRRPIFNLPAPSLAPGTDRVLSDTDSTNFALGNEGRSRYNSEWLEVGEEVGCGPGNCSSLGSGAPEDKRGRDRTLRARTNFVKMSWFCSVSKSAYVVLLK